MVERLELDVGWTLHLVSGDVPDQVRAALPIRASVPGCVHTDLLGSGLIPDPYLDRNELLLGWIGRAVWEYRRTLEVEEEDDVDDVRYDLVFDGLDTLATVAVNDVTVASTANMHRRYRIPVGTLLHPGTNTVSVRFDSAEAYTEEARERWGELPNAYPHAFGYLRKMACNFGWDWGPSLVTAGIWRSAAVERWRGARLAEVRPTATLDGTDGVATFQVTLDRASHVPVHVVARVGESDATAVVPAGSMAATLAVRVEKAPVWWPYGQGEQALVPATVRLHADVEVELDRWTARLGFRTVELDTEPDAHGTPFSIVVNHTPVPVRGVNWIPDDCFPSRITRDRIYERLKQARDAHVNLVRVWGGGVYESEEFYEVCDELGLLVWQDFAFACAAYPEEEPVRAEVDAEARDNVSRLMSHPSLVLWNGNNECFLGWADWGWQDELGSRTWGKGYYLDVLPAVVDEIDPSRPYWPGSPYSGSLDLHPNDDAHALQHVWDVWNDRDYTAYRDHRPRFAAEFGWQGPPSWRTLTSAVHDEPLRADSPGVLHHQKAVDGNLKLDRGLAPHFPPPSTLDDWLWAMQLNQARAVTVGVEHFRSLRPRNQGTIVWQLNDCWPVTSWSLVDSGGRRKPAWFALRTAYAPRLVTIQPRGGDLVLVSVNDRATAWRETVTVQRVTFTGEVLAKSEFLLDVPAFGAESVTLPTDLTAPADRHREVLVATTNAGDRTSWFFAEDRDADYPRAQLSAEVERDGDGVELRLTATTFVRDLAVFADRIAPQAEADGMLHTLLPGETATIRLRGPVEACDLQATPAIRTANDLVTRVRPDVTWHR